MSSEFKPPIKLIKCLYNINSTSDSLCISDNCFNIYAEKYDKELNYDGKKYSIDKHLIALVEELGLQKSSGFGTNLALQLVPEELKNYIDVQFAKGNKIVYIDYDKAYANILHKEYEYYKNGDVTDSQLLQLIYERYERIKYIKKSFDILMTQTLDKACEYPFVCERIL